MLQIFIYWHKSLTLVFDSLSYNIWLCPGFSHYFSSTKVSWQVIRLAVSFTGQWCSQKILIDERLVGEAYFEKVVVVTALLGYLDLALPVFCFLEMPELSIHQIFSEALASPAYMVVTPLLIRFFLNIYQPASVYSRISPLEGNLKCRRWPLKKIIIMNAEFVIRVEIYISCSEIESECIFVKLSSIAHIMVLLCSPLYSIPLSAKVMTNLWYTHYGFSVPAGALLCFRGVSNKGLQDFGTSRFR